MTLFEVLLMGQRHPWDGAGALKVVEAETAEEAAVKAHPNAAHPSSVDHVRVVALADPYEPVRVPIKRSAEYGRAVPAVPAQRDAEFLAAAKRGRE